MSCDQMSRNNRKHLLLFIIVAVVFFVFLSEALVLFGRYPGSTPAFFDRLTNYFQFASTVFFGAIAWLVYDLERDRNRMEERYDERDNRNVRIDQTEQVDEYISKVDDAVLSIYKHEHEYEQAFASLHQLKKHVHSLRKNYLLISKSVPELQRELSNMVQLSHGSSKERNKDAPDVLKEERDYYYNAIIKQIYEARTVIEDLSLFLDNLDSFYSSFNPITPKVYDETVKHLNMRYSTLLDLVNNNSNLNGHEDRVRQLDKRFLSSFSSLLIDNRDETTIFNLLNAYVTAKKVPEKYYFTSSLSESENDQFIKRLVKRIGQKHQRTRILIHVLLSEFLTIAFELYPPV